MKMPDLFHASRLKVVGIMSGTSLDGVDYVLCEIKREGQKLSIQELDHESVPFPKELRSQLMAAADHELNVAELAELHFELGRFYARKFEKILTKNSNWKPDLIGLHGQTVYHHGKVATLQIGEPSFLSLVAKVSVVSDFRPADIAVGGQGAPLAPFFHQVAFANSRQRVAVHNMGGISNLTSFVDGKIQQAFDTGPANMPMDIAVQILSKGRMTFDAGGKTARKGIINEDMVKAGLAHPFLKRKPPKSCGREEFGEKWVKPLLTKFKRLSLEDKLASLTEIVARSVANAYKRDLPELPTDIIISGGGARNLFLRERIQAHLPSVKVVTSEERGWSSQSIEGAAFALLAAARVWDISLDLGNSTGAQQPVKLGKITSL